MACVIYFIYFEVFWLVALIRRKIFDTQYEKNALSQSPRPTGSTKISRKKLFTDRVSVNKKYLTDRVSVNKKYLKDSVSVNKKYLTDSGVPKEKTGGSLLVVQKEVSMWGICEVLFIHRQCICEILFIHRYYL